MKSIGNVSDWLSYAGGALIKVANSAGSTVLCFISGQGMVLFSVMIQRYIWPNSADLDQAAPVLF